MSYKIIDFKNWHRKEYFEHYTKNVPCSYSLTTKINITELRKQRLKFYPTLLYALTLLVNRHEEFRTAYKNEELIIYNKMNPCYTIFHKENETFSNLWTEFTDNYTDFCTEYEKDIENFGQIATMNPKANIPENSFTISMLPWRSFDGFNINTQSLDYLLPIVSIGKFYEEHDKVMLPIAIQVHHGVCDGFHVSRFLNELEFLLEELPFLKQ